jgi:hypothetical protein
LIGLSRPPTVQVAKDGLGEGTAGITFTMAPEGNARRVFVDNLNIHGAGIFDRGADEGQ